MRSIRSPSSMAIPPNDFASRRAEVHVSRLIDRLENILDIDDDIIAIRSKPNTHVANASNQASILRVLIASPSDVDEEREAIRRVMEQWNAQYSSTLGAVLLPVDWRTHATLEMGERPQGILNRQLVETSDIVVAVFWTRLGTPHWYRRFRNSRRDSALRISPETSDALLFFKSHRSTEDRQHPIPAI